MMCFNVDVVRIKPEMIAASLTNYTRFGYLTQHVLMSSKVWHLIVISFARNSLSINLVQYFC